MAELRTPKKFDLWRNTPRNFWKLNWKQAEAFLREFRRRVDERVAALQANVRSTVGFSQWSADHSEASLMTLGEWVLRVGRLEVVQPEDIEVVIMNEALSPEERRSLNASARAVPRSYADADTIAIALDIGIYCGEMVRRVYPSVPWARCKARCSIDQNMPLLMMTTNNGFNPLVIPMNTVERMLRRERGVEAIRDVHAVWLKGAVASEEWRRERRVKKLVRRAKAK